MFESVPIWMMVLGFLAVLGPLVTLHEFGHYLVARIFGAGADAFSVGFGKELAGFTDKRGTRWKLSAIPLGGYVQFKGDMNPASQGDSEALRGMNQAERDQCFQTKPLWQRALIVAAGPATNFLIAIVIFAAFFMSVGKPVAVDADDQLRVAAFAENSAAKEAGVEIGDRIVAVDGEKLPDLRALQDTVMLHPGRTFSVEIARGSESKTFSITARPEVIEDRFGNESKIGLLGVQAASAEYDYERVGPVEATSLAFSHTWSVLEMMVTGVKQILFGVRSVRELGGPIKIAKFSGEQMSLGWLSYANFAALISLNLAFINLLPIPGLDGGHLAFYAAEAVRRKPLGQRSQELAFRFGISIVLALMVFVTINDLISLPIFGS